MHASYVDSNKPGPSSRYTSIAAPIVFSVRSFNLVHCVLVHCVLVHCVLVHCVLVHCVLVHCVLCGERLPYPTTEHELTI
jgi:hypothetical protein